MPPGPSRRCPDEGRLTRGPLPALHHPEEPALTASFLAAVLLAIVARYLGLTDEDLAILGPVMLIMAGVVIRAGVFAPAAVRDLLGDEGEPGS